MKEQFNYQDKTNMDAEARSLKEWLDITKDWDMAHELPKMVEHEGISVVRDDFIDGGTKARALDFLLSQVDNEWITYVCPRAGAAPYAIAKFAKEAGRKVKMYVPSSKRMSDLQAKMFELGCDEIVFERIASQKNLNLAAKKWAKENGAYFVPMGLKDELATAALIRVARMMPDRPNEVAVATSTGVLGRALRIAWPDTKFHSVAVARNLKVGEMGPGEFYSDTRPFLQDSKTEVPFPCWKNYDAKAWDYCKDNGVKAMWNVSAPLSVSEETEQWKDTIDSQCDWYQRRTYTLEGDRYLAEEETWDKIKETNNDK